MKNTLSLLSLFLVVLLFGFYPNDTQGQSNSSHVVATFTEAMSSGNMESLSSMVSKNVEFTRPSGQTNTLGAKQSIVVLKDFAKKHPVSEYTSIKDGVSGAIHYAVGKYVSGENEFDINIFLNNVGGTFKIAQIRVDRL